MDDLINRQMAIKEAVPVQCEGEVFMMVQVETLEGLPSAQPEINRCKDCMWYNDGYCPNVDGIRKSDFYCADSERRTDG